MLLSLVMHVCCYIPLHVVIRLSLPGTSKMARSQGWQVRLLVVCELGCGWWVWESQFLPPWSPPWSSRTFCLVAEFQGWALQESLKDSALPFVTKFKRWFTSLIPRPPRPTREESYSLSPLKDYQSCCETNEGELSRYDTEGNTPATKGLLLCDSTYIDLKRFC